VSLFFPLSVVVGSCSVTVHLNNLAVVVVVVVVIIVLVTVVVQITVVMQIDGWMGGQTHRWVDGCVDGWVGRWTDE
jgi:hypothetical protein